MASKLHPWRTPSATTTTRIIFSTAKKRLLHHGPDTIDELLDRHVVKTPKPDDDNDDPVAARRRLTSHRREALSLYRDIIRATRFFAWPDNRGVLWRDILRENARKEFEDARLETDPEIITKLLIGGRDAVQAAVDKLVDKSRKMVEEEKNKARQDRSRNW